MHFGTCRFPASACADRLLRGSRAVTVAAIAAMAIGLLASCTPAATTVSTMTSQHSVRAQSAAPTPAPRPSGVIEEGFASWYGPGFAGRLTANGEVFDPNELTAAHKTLPFDTRVRVTSIRNGRSVVVRINDRGPFKPGRIIDLSRAAAEAIGMVGSGVARVTVAIVSGEAGALRAEAFPALGPFEVIHPAYPIGTLLVLSGLEAADRILVRVVANEPMANGEATLLMSPELMAMLGPAVIVESE